MIDGRSCNTGGEPVGRIVAHFAGAFHDALREHGHVAGAIFEHPEFEVLETKDPPQ